MTHATNRCRGGLGATVFARAASAVSVAATRLIARVREHIADRRSSVAGQGVLDADDLRALHGAAISAGLAHSRAALMVGVDRKLAAGIPLLANDRDQVIVDLDELNRAGTLLDGTVPLSTWLANAALLAGNREESVLFERKLRRAAARAHMRASRG